MEVLQPELERVTPNATLIVYNCAALCQGGAADEEAIAKILMKCSAGRRIYWLHCENEEVRLRAIDRGHLAQSTLAHIDGHGRWLEWLDAS